MKTAIAPNTTYIAAYFTTSGYGVSRYYFVSQGVNSGPLHALQSGAIDRGFTERPPAKASLFEPSADLAAAPASGVPLAAKVHALDDSIRGALADWLAGVFVTDGRPDAAARAALPPAAVLVNREGDQFTRHTVSLHAPDAADAGLLARQAEIETLEARCGAIHS